MKFTFARSLFGFFYFGAAFCLTAPDIEKGVKEYIGRTDWTYSSHHRDRFGSVTNKCNLFVFDVLNAVGAQPPSRVSNRYSPIGAAEWGNPSSSYLTAASCWNTCKGGQQKGDVIGDGKCVGIITGNNLTTSGGPLKVVENNWGYRSSGSGSANSITAC